MIFKFRRMTDALYKKEAHDMEETNNAYSTFEMADAKYSKSVPTSHINTRFYFGLSHYVVNEVFAGSDLRNINRMRGLTQEQARELCHFKLFYNETTRELIPLEDAITHPQVVKAGGDAVEAIMMNTSLHDFALRLCRTMQEAFDNNRRNMYIRGLILSDKKTPDCGRVFLPGIYCEPVFKKKGVPDITEELIQEQIEEARYRIFEGGNTLCSKMYAIFSRGKDGVEDFFKCCVSKYVMLVPRSMRTTRESNGMKQHDPLDAMYSKVYLSNYTLHNISFDQDNFHNFVQAYRNLQTHFTNLVSKRADSGDKAKSLMGKLSAKSGQIRGTNLGKRIDYSGRSVIVVNPTLSLREIRIPKRVLPSLLAHDICKAMSDPANASDCTASEWIAMSSEERRNKGIKFIEDHPSLLDTPIPIGRQPTLHKGSITSYYAKPTDNNAMELNPLACPPFNADFDGDTMWYACPLSDAAKEESKRLLLGVMNPFWAKDGKPTMIPRQEIVYGLNVCTQQYKLNEATTQYMNDTDAYNAVIRNKMFVYDSTRDAETKELTTIGRLAFKHCIKGIQHMVRLKGVVRRVCACPICLEQQEIDDDTADYNTAHCSKHTNVKLIPVHKYAVGKCLLCGKETSMGEVYEKRGCATPSYVAKHANFENVFDTLIAPYKSKAERLEALYKFCEALEELKLHKEAYSKTLMTIQTLASSEVIYNESLKPLCRQAEEAIEQRRFKNSAEYTQVENSKYIIAFLKACMPLSYSDFVRFTKDLKPEATATGSARLYVNDAGEFEQNPSITYLECANEFYKTFDRNEFIRIAGAISAEVDASFSDINDDVSNLNTSPVSCKHCGTIVSKNIGIYINQLLVHSTAVTPGSMDLYVDSVDKMVKLGFTVAKYYAPALNVLKSVDFSAYMNEFYSKVKKLNDMYDLGFMEEETYANAYSDELTALGKKAEKGIGDLLGPDNGFLKMVQSGARGSDSNLVQIFGFKGRVIKNSTESFNAVIDSCYAKQLSPLQHFLSAYGARRGIMDRSLETANTGYASRQLWHAMQGMVITNKDCGTKNGVVIKRSMLNVVANLYGEADRESKEDDLLVSFLTGRCLAGTSKIITKAEAKRLVANQDEFVVRSPITCDNPCCQYCYGRDMSTHDLVVVGTPIGIMGAESIGETTAQLTMRTFQGGGVAKKGGISSAFEHLQSYISLKNITHLPTYEPTAWKSGHIYARDKEDDITKLVVTIVGEDEVLTDNWKGRDVVYVDKDSLLKDYVDKGDGLFTVAGDQYIPEVVKTAGITQAGLYFAMKIYNIFSSQGGINLKHFETLAASMIRGLVTYSENSELNIGCSYSKKELLSRGWNPSSKDKVKWGFYKVIDIPTISPEAVANIDFESVGEGLFNIMAYGRPETFADPIENIVFGQEPNVGSKVNSNYIADRSSFVISEDIV